MAAIATRRFTVDEYQRMAETGILGEDERVELIAGEIVAMSPIGARHVDCVDTLNELLVALVGRDARVSIQNPFRLVPDSEPEPDITLLRRRRYRAALATAADVLLLIEVADSSLAYDRRRKLPLYAAAGIAEAWLVDLIDEGIERHTEPGADGYGRVSRARRGESLASTVLPALILDVDAVFG